MNFLGFILAQCLGALSQAAILFFIACGLTLIFGIMRIVNFAHGVIFMLGAYVGYTAHILTDSFIAALILAPIVVGVVGMAFEYVFLRHLYGRRDGGAYLLLTFGLAVVLSEIIRLIWGPQPLSAGIPDALRGIVIILNQPFPLYRLFLIGLGVAAAIAVWQFLERTRAVPLDKPAGRQHAPGVTGLRRELRRPRRERLRFLPLPIEEPNSSELQVRVGGSRTQRDGRFERPRGRRAIAFARAPHALGDERRACRVGRRLGYQCGPSIRHQARGTRHRNDRPPPRGRPHAIEGVARHRSQRRARRIVVDDAVVRPADDHDVVIASGPVLDHRHDRSSARDLASDRPA